MKTYLLIDLYNLVFRSKHAHVKYDLDSMIGLTFSTIFYSIRKSWNLFQPDHIVICCEGRSWRKDNTSTYKLNRRELYDLKTPDEKLDDQIFMEAVSDLQKFFLEKTNVTVLQKSGLEADDMIAFWIDLHPDDNHIILSSDSDFHQLIAPNVKQFDGVKSHVLSLDGVFDEKGKPVLDKKTREPLPAPEPEWELFLKCIRGDSGDNIFPAYPGARVKSSKKSVGIREAFEDRHRKGFAWSNFMLSRWVDENGVEHRVKDRYEQNRHLIDLRAQPDEIKELGKTAILEAIDRPQVSMVGIHFVKFCSAYNLNRLKDNPTDLANLLNARYL